MEFFLCDSDDLENPDGVVTQVTNHSTPIRDRSQAVEVSHRTQRSSPVNRVFSVGMFNVP